MLMERGDISCSNEEDEEKVKVEVDKTRNSEFLHACDDSRSV
jgi:hypothetical protein